MVRASRASGTSATPIYDQLINECGDPHIPPISLEPPKLLKAGPLGYLPPPALPSGQRPRASAPAHLGRG